LRSHSERSGLLAHTAKPKSRSQLRVREPRRSPRGLSREESAALLGSLRSWRDRAIGGLMLLSGLRSAEVLSLRVADLDITRRWVRVFGNGGKERPVSIDTDVAGAIQTYLLAERPETDAGALFVVAKGEHRRQPLTPAGLRTVFRYHRERSGDNGRGTARVTAA
jgi:integrase